MAQVPVTRNVEIVGSDQQLQGELAHGLEEPVARSAACALADGDPRLVNELRKHVEREGGRDRNRRVSGEATGEHTESRERFALSPVKKRGTPLDRTSARSAMWRRARRR